MMTANRLHPLTEETAIVEVAKLVNVTEADGGGVIVYSGEHPDFGCVHIVVPAFGNGFLLLPFVFQQS